MASLAQERENPLSPVSKPSHIGLSTNECRDLISIWMIAFALLDRATESSYAFVVLGFMHMRCSGYG
jgi:hypothetical protein